uniref:Uncharacterized protein n=1 Tax=Candidatus Kentrum sp. TC TaxID=2126339 RepID=A0A450Z481_9GAMM|nr:MAG: hypothetical protein BECKTC1821D_GA0114238_106216 [Candidatus Kentron sp. TC]
MLGEPPLGAPLSRVHLIFSAFSKKFVGSFRSWWIIVDQQSFFIFRGGKTAMIVGKCMIQSDFNRTIGGSKPIRFSGSRFRLAVEAIHHPIFEASINPKPMRQQPDRCRWFLCIRATFFMGSILERMVFAHQFSKNISAQ